MANEEEKKSDDEEESLGWWSFGVRANFQPSKWLLSGCEHPDVLAFSKCAGFGHNMNLYHRDAMSLYCLTW